LLSAGQDQKIHHEGHEGHEVEQSTSRKVSADITVEPLPDGDGTRLHWFFFVAFPS
jgi:hypothetical protein